MSRKPKASSAALDAAGEEDIVIIRAANPEHDRMVADGYRLAASSRIWLRTDRSYTLRLVYRHRDPGGRFFEMVSYVIRGVFA